MSLKNFYLWLTNSLLGLGLLLQGVDSPGKFSLFLSIHGLSAFFAYQFFVMAIIFSKDIRSIIGTGFQGFLITILIIPLLGPTGIIIITLVLIYFPVKATAHEEFEIIDSVWLENYTYEIEELEFYKIYPPSIINNQLSFEQSIWALKKLHELEWFPYKTRILQLFLEYHDNPAITLEASYIINSKKDGILTKIKELEKYRHPDNLKLANLYHEIAYLGLVGPVLEKYYREIACKYILNAVEEYPADAEIHIIGIKYHLENHEFKKAEKLLTDGMNKFHENMSFQKNLRPFLKEIQYLKGIGIEKLERELSYAQ